MAPAVHGSAGGRLVLVLPDGSRVPVESTLTIGRAEEADVRIDDLTVSRLHVRISVDTGGATIEDAGSRFGTRLSGLALTRPAHLRPGAAIRLGDVTIRVEGTMDSFAPVAVNGELGAGPAETVVVPVDATAMGLRVVAPGPAGLTGELRPRVRSGWALKRLGTDEGVARFVLQDLRTRRFVRMEPDDAALFELLDGARTISQLLVDAENRVGATGPARLTRLLADLADRGLLTGVEPAPAPTAHRSWLARLLAPRERAVTWAGPYFERAYHDWGRIFFLPVSLTLLVLFAVAGFGAFACLVGARYGTPFVVAHRLVIGGAVFIVGRFALVAAHELAHGLALAHYGRRAPRAGLRVLLIFPYAFVDTSEAYFESRPHRIVISAAGPASDLTLGAAFSLACAICPAGPIRDVFFQLAFGAYLGAFFNLNPFLDRDGYNILADFLRESRLRQRARRQLARRLSGAEGDAEASPLLGRFALAGVIWSAVGASLTVLVSNRYSSRLDGLLPHAATRTLFLGFYVMLFIPVLAQLGIPLIRRARIGPREVNRVLD
jgi:Zn-dependent protease